MLTWFDGKKRGFGVVARFVLGLVGCLGVVMWGLPKKPID